MSKKVKNAALFFLAAAVPFVVYFLLYTLKALQFSLPKDILHPAILVIPGSIFMLLLDVSTTLRISLASIYCVLGLAIAYAVIIFGACSGGSCF